MGLNKYTSCLLVFLALWACFAGWASAQSPSPIVMADDTLSDATPTPMATLTPEGAMVGAGCCIFNIATIFVGIIVILLLLAAITLVKYAQSRKNLKMEADDLARAVVDGDIPRLVHFLRSPRPEVRVEAASAIEARGVSALEPLLVYLPEAGKYRINALRNTGKSLDVHVERIGQELWILIDVGPQAIPSLVNSLSTAKNDLNHVTRVLLKSFGSDAVMPLASALNSPDTIVKATAASILGELMDSRAIDPLIAAVRDPDKIVRLEAVRALDKFDDPRAIEALKTARKDSSWEVQAAAAKALGDFSSDLTGLDGQTDVPLSNNFPMDFSMPQTDGGTIIEREVVREIVKVPCKYCGTLVEITKSSCQSCGAPFKL